VYENEVLEPIAGLHKLGSQVTDGAEDIWRVGTNIVAIVKRSSGSTGKKV
jgi:hypothetical protein